MQIIKRLESFKYAFNGLKILFKEEHNAQVHILAALCVLVAGVLFKISASEWIAVFFAIGLVTSLEIMNTAIENMADFISPGKHEKIRRIKDLSAAGVLIGAFTALAIGFMVFVPKIIAL